MSEGPIIGDWTQYEWIPDDASSFPARIRLRDTAWMVYYEPDVTGLKAEVLLLRKENKELRELCGRALVVIENNCSECAYFYECNIITDCKCAAPQKIRDELRELGVTA